MIIHALQMHSLTDSIPREPRGLPPVSGYRKLTRRDTSRENTSLFGTLFGKS